MTRKKSQPPAALERANFPHAVSAALDQLDADLARREMSAAIHRVKARQQFSAVVHSLIPVAAGQARKGKTRLLAVLGKILGDEQLDERSAHVLKQLALSLERKIKKQ